MQIPNLRTSADRIHESLNHFVLDSEKKAQRQSADGELIEIRKQITNLLAYINKHSFRKNASPADLSTPSFRIFLWLRFLSHHSNILTHTMALDEFLTIISEHKFKDRIDIQKLLVKINYSGYLYRRQTNQGHTTLQIHEALISAPQEIKKAVISAALSRRRTKHVEIVRSFASSSNYQRIIKQISGNPLANHITYRGNKFDLSLLYAGLNTKYFSNLLQQPRLTWSTRSSKRRLGYYHPEIQTIVINNQLDHKKIPRILVEYILYHEMLHQHFGIKHINGRRYAHTPKFREAEMKFKNRDEAENLIKYLQ